MPRACSDGLCGKTGCLRLEERQEEVREKVVAAGRAPHRQGKTKNEQKRHPPHLLGARLYRGIFANPIRGKLSSHLATCTEWDESPSPKDGCFRRQSLLSLSPIFLR